ncbi:MAG: polysaccharide biosynthesis protein, partial [Pirellulales bacterium]
MARRFLESTWCAAPLRWQLSGLLAGLPAFALIYWTTYWLRFDGAAGGQRWPLFLSTVVWVVVVKSAVFAWLGIFQDWRRSVSFHDLLALSRAVTLSLLGIVVVDGMLLSHVAVPRSILLLDWGVTLVVLGGLRGLSRVARDAGTRFFSSQKGVPVLIVGADDTGEALLRAIRRHLSHGRTDGRFAYQVVGFLDETERAVGRRVGGVPVVGTLDKMCELSVRLGVREVLITAGSLAGKQVRRLVDDGRRHAIRVRILPSYEQLLDERVAFQPRPVAIDDLLRRDSIELDMQKLCRWINGRVVLVTGSAGSIGSEICRQLLQLSPAKLVLVDHSECGQFHLERELKRVASGTDIVVSLGSITDFDRMETIFGEHLPNIVFHAAAYKHVPLLESHPGEAVKNIILGTQFVADLAHRFSAAAFVMISTDKAVNPSSVMGACKRVAEQYVQSLDEESRCRYVTVRFGNVLDSAGSVVPIFRQQIAEGGPVTVTHPEMTRYFMTIPEASQLVLQAGAMGKGGEIFVLDMGDPVRIVDLAHDMIRLSGLRVGEDIEIDFIGLRPGEKLYEELHGVGERRTTTPHSKILVAEGDRRDLVSLLADINCLAGKMHGPDEELVAEVRRLNPDFGRP